MGTSSLRTVNASWEALAPSASRFIMLPTVPMGEAHFPQKRHLLARPLVTGSQSRAHNPSFPRANGLQQCADQCESLAAQGPPAIAAS